MKNLLGLGLIMLLLSPSRIALGFTFPEEKKDYIGNWRAEGYRLLISETGGIDYKKEMGGVQKSFGGQITAFEGNDFVVEYLFFLTTTFYVTQSPYRDGDIWKMVVDGVEVSRPAKIAALSIPSKSELEKLIGNSIHAFALSVIHQDFSYLYDTIAEFWKNQTTAKELQSIFQVFIDKKIDLTPLKGETPIIGQNPQIDSERRLRLQGYYLLKPYKVDYELKYLYEYPQWKLVAITVNM